MRKPRVYIACPISKGNRIFNFTAACHAQERLLQLGFAPLNPALSMMHPNAWLIEHETWLTSDLAWVEAADVVLRLEGESIGADREVAHALSLGIPVVHSAVDAIRWCREVFKREIRCCET